VGELEDVRWASPALTVACAREHPDVIVGVKVRLGYQMVGQDPEAALLAARKAADRLELPLMVHVIDMPRPLPWLLSHLGDGDVVTHCFHGSEGGLLLDDAGHVLPASLAVGREADVTVLELVRGDRELVDAAGERVFASEWLTPRWVVRGGEAIELDSRPPDAPS